MERYNSTRATKKGWKSFFKPGWILALLAILGFSYAAFTVLAPWQLNKDDQIVERNEQIDAAFRTDPVPVQDIFGTDGAISPGDEWRRVTLTGHYLPASEVVLRLRPVDSQPAFHALTPFQLDSGETILVNRGFSAPLEGSIPDLAPAPSEHLTIHGHARLNEALPTTPPLLDQGEPQVYGINTSQVAELTGLTLDQDYVQLSEGEPGEINAIPVPKLDRGSHLSYGFQWIAFGIMAPLGLGYFIWAELRERRRVRDENEELIDVVEDIDTAPSTTTSRRRARYGDESPDHYDKFSRRSRERF
ncbi:SURF1 family protein [Corynebacterium atrinae]|nr:SURF1 family protein [Corynebacterium atrinae]WJY63894.1 SURF1 family protein [Corynebacterium atrinae]